MFRRGGHQHAQHVMMSKSYFMVNVWFELEASGSADSHTQAQSLCSTLICGAEETVSLFLSWSATHSFHPFPTLLLCIYSRYPDVHTPRWMILETLTVSTYLAHAHFSIRLALLKCTCCINKRTLRHAIHLHRPINLKMCFHIASQCHFIARKLWKCGLQIT